MLPCLFICKTFKTEISFPITTGPTTPTLLTKIISSIFFAKVPRCTVSVLTSSISNLLKSIIFLELKDATKRLATFLPFTMYCSISTSSKFVPSLEIPGSPDVREFGVNIQNISDFDCSKN